MMAALATGDRVTIREDAFPDAPRLVAYRGRAGEVVKRWDGRFGNSGLVLLRLADGDTVYVFSHEVEPVTA